MLTANVEPIKSYLSLLYAVSRKEESLKLKETVKQMIFKSELKIGVASNNSKLTKKLSNVWRD